MKILSRKAGIYCASLALVLVGCSSGPIDESDRTLSSVAQAMLSARSASKAAASEADAVDSGAPVANAGYRVEVGYPVAFPFGLIGFDHIAAAMVQYSITRSDPKSYDPDFHVETTKGVDALARRVRMHPAILSKYLTGHLTLLSDGEPVPPRECLLEWLDTDVARVEPTVPSVSRFVQAYHPGADSHFLVDLIKQIARTKRQPVGSSLPLANAFFEDVDLALGAVDVLFVDLQVMVSHSGGPRALSGGLSEILEHMEIDAQYTACGQVMLGVTRDAYAKLNAYPVTHFKSLNERDGVTYRVWDEPKQHRKRVLLFVRDDEGQIVPITAHGYPKSTWRELTVAQPSFGTFEGGRAARAYVIKEQPNKEWAIERSAGIALVAGERSRKIVTVSAAEDEARSLDRSLVVSRGKAERAGGTDPLYRTIVKLLKLYPAYGGADEHDASIFLPAETVGQFRQYARDVMGIAFEEWKTAELETHFPVIFGRLGQVLALLDRTDEAADDSQSTEKPKAKSKKKKGNKKKGVTATSDGAACATSGTTSTPSGEACAASADVASVSDVLLEPCAGGAVLVDDELTVDDAVDEAPPATYVRREKAPAQAAPPADAAYDEDAVADRLIAAAMDQLPDYGDVSPREVEDALRELYREWRKMGGTFDGAHETGHGSHRSLKLRKGDGRAPIVKAHGAKRGRRVYQVKETLTQTAHLLARAGKRQQIVVPE